MSSVRASKAFAVGRWGEDEVRRWLMQRPGCFVLPVNMIESGGAPRAVSALRSVTLPDLGVMACGTGEWWEVKTKRRAAWNQTRSKHVHGIARRLWNDYRAVETQSGWRGYLAVITQEPPRLVAATLARLADVLVPHCGSREPFGEEMVWFDEEDFEVLLASPQWCTPSPPSLPITVVHPWPDPEPPAFRQAKLW